MLIVNFVYLLKDFLISYMILLFVCVLYCVDALTFKMLSFMIVLRHHILEFSLELLLLIRVKTTFTVAKIYHPGEYYMYVVYM